MNDRIAILAVAAMSIATVAIGLRVGAGDDLHAAIVIGAPLPKGSGHAAWQLRTQDDDGRTRTASTTRFSATIRARGAERKIDGATNIDGVAELAIDVPDLAWGDRIELDVRDGTGRGLAHGIASWPHEAPRPTIFEHATLRASRSDGALRMKLAVLGGALAPGETGHVWVTTSATGESPRGLRIDVTPDIGIDVDKPYAASRDALCTSGGVIELVARGHIGGVALHAKDELAREGAWYGAIPIAAGAMYVDAPLTAAPGPVRVTITSASARSLAYVEVDDDDGRAYALTLPLMGEPPRAETTFDLRTPGRSFIVVSVDPEGATTLTGATRARPIWIGPNAPCESELAEISAQAFPRFVALDGFVDKKAALAARRKRGRMIALGALALGSLLETLLLLRAAREGRRRLVHLQNAIVDGVESRAVGARRGALDVLVVLMVSLLGFVLLFALIEWTSR